MILAVSATLDFVWIQMTKMIREAIDWGAGIMHNRKIILCRRVLETDARKNTG